MQSLGHDSIRWAFAFGNFLSAAGFVGVFAALPARYWAVDVPTLLLCVLSAASAVGLARKTRWWPRALRASAFCELVAGLAALAALALAVSYLGGVHGELGNMTVGFWIAGSLLLLPYLIVYPALQLVWLHAQTRTS